MYQALPLSAIIIPYFLSAVRMTFVWALYGLMSKLAFKRNRAPIIGRSGSSEAEA